ncbi:phosphoribosylformylglycinamidine synthase [Tepidibacter formicigenes]|jgi:phosphoribosylformylglycinamidine synthase|uniref:Phosphoribosylformylglycinamidine synthase n=1 Tax=Tepidibacter formicigenes DSM 15518 TaxID=1123349 RepID=A0A1M6NE21_9FIRM|nr:phosphoribosylformylglycinamidine synthase [Tepidibacter formicigenes]SHJ93971.1 phosphoribosylformylglycinamidine synthase [Tepidibacter formicigenes DSM 15518]
MANIKRIFVEKKYGFDVEAQHLYKDIKNNLRIDGLNGIRILNRYDIEGISDDAYYKAAVTIFSEPNIDNIYHEEIEINKNEKVFAIEYLPGQYDQRGDWAGQCVEILTGGKRPIVNTAKVIILNGNISDEDFDKIKKYCINPVDSREASIKKPKTLEIETEIPTEVEVLDGFIDLDDDGIKSFIEKIGLAMAFEDLKFIREYFKNTEKRNPTITEIKVLDTYWSDHCRHTTFLTEIENIEIEDGIYSNIIKNAYEEYLSSRKYVYEDENKGICLMDIAVIAMKELRKKGMLDDLEVSEEINACSIEVDVDVNGKKEKYLVMFKNETHNHPTEIEPFGGAATCLGGAIRDPLSGRSYVYQAMRVTGSSDPRTKIEDTISGKLPQIKITTEAAHGYSSYGNQIGLATGHVAEVYDEDFVAKRMEIGAVIAATPKENVIRKTPSKGDCIILVGGRTGRDGCGGATGSSKEHSEESILTCSAEVQKGNAPTERKIQRLFRNKNVSTMIKKCNDFGAGGVCVAIGELARGLDINLDLVPKKYEGLDGTELAISESQERMAVVVSKEDVDKFIKNANEENLEATHVATVTDHNRMRMYFRDKLIVDISREFIDTNGVKQKTNVLVKSPEEEKNYFKNLNDNENLKDKWIENIQDLNICSQRGLVERFDSSIGAGTVLMPFGGKYQSTPTEGMVAKIPVLNGDTSTGTIMTYGYNPKIGKWSPFHGAMYAVVESVCKVVAMGGNYKTIRLTLQEYFEKLGDNKEKWGKPLSALLGAFYVQKQLNIPAIGGKDSMSGTFKDIDVPPTLVSFAVDTVDVNHVISPEFKNINSKVVYLSTKKYEDEVIDFDELKKNLEKVTSLIKNKKVISVHTVKSGGICEAISKMSFGNKIGFKFEDIKENELFSPDYGSFILEINENVDVDKEFEGYNYKVLGNTQEKPFINVNGIELELDEIHNKWCEPLESVFSTKTEPVDKKIGNVYYKSHKILKSKLNIGKPRVIIPVFPGTNCEYDLTKAFEKSGAIVNTSIFKNLTQNDIKESIDNLVKEINSSQIIMLPGGFSAGDEPDGSGKFIATIFRNPKVKEAVMKFLNNKDGLILGICNGFQALIKLGLLPYGEIKDTNEDDPTLTYNKIGRHQSRIVRTKITSNLSPWLSNVNVGDVHSIAISHGEGRFVCSEDLIKKLIENGQVATQYVDFDNNATYDIDFNPNGSFYAVEGITSLDGRIFGKMGHSERIGSNVFKNIEGFKEQKIFESGVNYFK